MASNIHESAIVSPNAQIDESVKIGPYSIIEDGVILHKNVVIKSHVVIESGTEIGENTTVYPFASLGGRPQDLKYNDEPTKLIVGKNNQIRESCVIHRGTVGDSGATIIGDNNLIMGHVHIAHDCVIGNNVVMSHSAKLAGHVNVEDGAILGGQSGFHQFCRVGEMSFVGGHSAVTHDVPPFTIYASTRTEQVINGLNVVGLRRKGYSNDEIFALKSVAFAILENTQASSKELAESFLKQHKGNRLVEYFIDFVLCEKPQTRGVSARLAK